MTAHLGTVPFRAIVSEAAPGLVFTAIAQKGTVPKWAISFFEGVVWEMFVIMGKVEMLLPWSHSLKEKRMVQRSLTEKLRQRFRLSVAQLDEQDSWQHLVLGMAGVSSDYVYLVNMEELILQLIEESFPVEFLSREFEIVKK